MNPKEKKDTPSKAPLISFLAALIVFIILSFIGFPENDMKEMAPGSPEIEDVQEPLLIAKTESPSQRAVIESTAVDMPTPVVSEAAVTSFGTIETENGEYDLSGL